MLLTVDIGNTTLRAGLYDAARLVDLWTGPTHEAAALAGWLRGRPAVDAMVAGSVVPDAEARLARALGGAVRWAGRDLPIPLAHAYRPPESLGSDRLLAALAARERYGAPVLVADCGTATTLEAVRADGSYAGGAILCGLATQRDALAQRAAQLPAIPLAAPARAVGDSTLACLQSGLVLGHAGAVAWLAERVRAELACPRAPLVGTGGLAAVLAEAVPELFAAVDDHLVLDGLRLCWERRNEA